jgi:hypothetical protein
VTRANVGAAYDLAPRRSLRLTYTLLEDAGATPFLFDAVDPDDLTNEASLLYHRAGERGPAATAFRTGLSYKFRDATTSVVLGYGERIAARYHWDVTAEYNLVTTDTTLTVDLGSALGYGTYATVAAVYHTLTRTFEDLDFTVTARLCDCLDVSLVYRQVRREIWVQVGLSAFPSPRLQFQPTAP